MSFLTTPVLGIPLWLWLGVTVVVAVVAVVVVLRLQSEARRQRVETLKNDVAAAMEQLTLSLPLKPNPYVFVDNVRGVRGAMQAAGHIHVYVETTRSMDAMLVCGSLLPRLRDQKTGFMELKSLSPSSWHGDMPHPGEGSLVIGSRLRVLPKPQNVDDACKVCLKLKATLEASVTRSNLEKGAMTTASNTTT